MHSLVLQAIVPAGITIDPAWVVAGITTIIGSLGAAVGVVYRGQIAALAAQNEYLAGECKHKDDLINQLITQVGRAADVQDRTVAVVERSSARR